MLPELDQQRILRWADSRNKTLPERARGQIRYEVDLTATSATILECRPPWRADFGPDWTRFPVARLRYNRTHNNWSLYWRDRNLRFHLYDLVAPAISVDDLLAEIDRDETGIFWGWQRPTPQGGNPVSEFRRCRWATFRVDTAPSSIAEPQP